MLKALDIKPDMEHAPEAGEYGVDEVHAMQRAMISLFSRWGVSDTDAAVLLGGIAAKTFRRWKEGDYGRVNRDLADRMSNLLGIHKALRLIFTDKARGYDWVKAQNSIFAENTPLAIMKQGGMEDIIRIRRYLDSVRGGW